MKNVYDNNYKPNISGFVDFCEYHQNGEPIFFVNGRLYASYDMMVRLDTRYNFIFEDTKENIEKAIKTNFYMFNALSTNAFYYPNDNMFSHPCPIERIDGYVLTLKRKYR